MSVSIDVFESSADNAITIFAGDTDATTDCALAWSLEKHPDTPSTLQATIDGGLTEGTTGGILSATASVRRFTVTSTDFLDVGVHIVYLKAWYTNYPDTNPLTTTITVTVADCGSTTANCECAWLEFAADLNNWGDVEYIKPASLAADHVLFAADANSRVI